MCLEDKPNLPTARRLCSFAHAFTFFLNDDNNRWESRVFLRSAGDTGRVEALPQALLLTDKKVLFKKQRRHYPQLSILISEQREVMLQLSLVRGSWRTRTEDTDLASFNCSRVSSSEDPGKRRLPLLLLSISRRSYKLGTKKRFFTVIFTIL